MSKPDGANTYASGMHNSSNIRIEVVESQLSLTVTHYRLHGQRRRRPAPRRPGTDATIAHRQPTRALHREHGPLRQCAFRAYGRGPAAMGPVTRIRNGVATKLPPRSDNVPLVRGDRVRLEVSGDGGLGDPPRRDPALVLRDRALGYLGAG